MPDRTGISASHLAWWLKAARPLDPVGAQSLSQALSLATQLGLIAVLGAQGFAAIGLGLLTATTICFLGEVGYGPTLLREAVDREWMAKWRDAISQRLFVTLAALPVGFMALSWGSPAPESSAVVLAAAFPGTLAATFNPTPILFGLSRVRLACSGILARALCQTILCVTATAAFPGHAPLWVGIAFSVGVMVQLAISRMAGLPLQSLIPAPRLRMPPPTAIKLWGLSLLGTVSDRTLPFLFGLSHPQSLSHVLITIQMMQAVAGAISHVDRRLIPDIRSGKTLHGHANLPWPLVALSAAVLAALTAAAAFFRPDLTLAAFLMGLEWGGIICGTFLFSTVFAVGGEGRVVRLMLILVPLSIAGQIILAQLGLIDIALAIRAMVAWLVVHAILKAA